MKKKNIIFLFIIGLLVFWFIPSLKAEGEITVASDATISTSTTNFISTAVTISDNASEIINNQYNYILFNGALTYGGEQNALDSCNMYCNSCQKYQRSPGEYAFYVCKTYNLKSGYFAVHNGRVPSAIKAVDSTSFPKVSTQHQCRYVKYSDESNIGGSSGLTKAASYIWVCESKVDCDNTCSGSCVSPQPVVKIENRDKLYFCSGRKLPNVYVTINGQEVNADTLSSITDADLKDWKTYTGDGNGVNIQTILMVMGGEITCEGALGDVINIVKDIFMYIKIGAVTMLILFTTIDFMKGVVSGEKETKVAVNNFIKRVVVLIVIFILPSLINLVLSIIQIGNNLCGL